MNKKLKSKLNKHNLTCLEFLILSVVYNGILKAKYRFYLVRYSIKNETLV